MNTIIVLLVSVVHLLLGGGGPASLPGMCRGVGQVDRGQALAHVAVQSVCVYGEPGLRTGVSAPTQQAKASHEILRSSADIHTYIQTYIHTYIHELIIY